MTILAESKKMYPIMVREGITRPRPVIRCLRGRVNRSIVFDFKKTCSSISKIYWFLLYLVAKKGQKNLLAMLTKEYWKVPGAFCTRSSLSLSDRGQETMLNVVQGILGEVLNKIGGDSL